MHWYGRLWWPKPGLHRSDRGPAVAARSQRHRLVDAHLATRGAPGPTPGHQADGEPVGRESLLHVQARHRWCRRPGGTPAPTPEAPPVSRPEHETEPGDCPPRTCRSRRSRGPSLPSGASPGLQYADSSVPASRARGGESGDTDPRHGLSPEEMRAGDEAGRIQLTRGRAYALVEAGRAVVGR